jgi:hypothetical protein
MEVVVAIFVRSRSLPHSGRDVHQLRAVGLDDESPPLGQGLVGSRSGRPRRPRSPWPDQSRGLLLYLAADDVTLDNLSVLKNGRAKAIRFSTMTGIRRALDRQPGDILPVDDP